MRHAVYTDGASSADGSGGWAWTDGDYNDSGFEPGTTNQRMEMLAAIEAMEAYDVPIAIHSDSAYVVNGMTCRWYDVWKRNGWRNSARKPVANRDLWERLAQLAAERGTEFVKVKGHAGHPLNEEADRLAVAAKKAGRAP